MARFFNTTGPCNPQDHYMLPPEDRLVRAQLARYIDQKLYWVLHAPRQTGKTTFLQSWMKKINASGQALACYVSVERCQGIGDLERAIPAICSAIKENAGHFLMKEQIPKIVTTEPESMLSATLIQWAAQVAPLPLVVLFDEVDVLEDQAMISFLRQLRGGFAARGVGKFPVSVALVGMRDLRDYIVHVKDGQLVRPGSPFNVKQDSASLANFTLEDIQTLVGQHTAETGQIFEPSTLSLIFELTRGQPWLTNALLQKCTWELCPNGETVTPDHIRLAKEKLIQAKAVHLDSLSERLRDPRVRRVVQAILIGDMDPTLTDGDDFLLTQDLGLVVKEQGSIGIANPIYREVIARVLSQGMQDAIPAPEFTWKKPNGTLDLDALLREFQVFWRRHADLWEAKADYTEAFPHLLLMAFLQRVINGGGQVEREYAAGRGRMDLGILYGGQWTIVEIKLVHPADGRDYVVTEGLKQIARYRDLIDPAAPCYLVVFDRTPAGRATPWEQRLSWEVILLPDEKSVTVVGA